MQNKLLEGEDLERGQLIKVRVGNGPWQLALVLDKDGDGWETDGAYDECFWRLYLVNSVLTECLPKNAQHYRGSKRGNAKRIRVYKECWEDKWRAFCIAPDEFCDRSEEYSVRFKEVSK